jgi:hypothetical protein
VADDDFLFTLVAIGVAVAGFAFSDHPWSNAYRYSLKYGLTSWNDVQTDAKRELRGRCFNGDLAACSEEVACSEDAVCGKKE